MRQPLDFIFQNQNGKEYTTASFRKLILDGCRRLKILDGRYVFKGSDYQRRFTEFLYDNGLSIPTIRGTVLREDNENGAEQYVLDCEEVHFRQLNIMLTLIRYSFRIVLIHCFIVCHRL